MDLKNKTLLFRSKRPSEQELQCPVHGFTPLVAYAVQLGSVASTLHPLAFSLPAAIWSPLLRETVIFSECVLTPTQS